MRTVKQASMETGMSPDTLRYYDKAGLLVGVNRDSAGGRVFDDEAIGWLRCIVALRESGMSVAEVRRFAVLAAEGAETSSLRLAILAQCKENLSKKAQKVDDCICLIEGLIDETASNVSQ